MVVPDGRNSGSITEAMISRLINGTPRISSMNPTQRPLIRGRLERRPSASRTYRREGEGEGEAIG